MLVEVDKKSGFCYGVQKTIKLAEDALVEGNPLYCLGEIVHNEEEVERLKSKGLTIITHEELVNLRNANILVRAHGEPPSTYEKLNKNLNILSEGTCPIVLQLQKKVRASWMEYKDKQGQIVIYGKKGHAEVIGLAGQTEGQAILVENIRDLEQIDFAKPVILFAQTTQPPSGYQELADAIQSKMKPFFQDSVPLYITNSICGHVSKRGEHLATFSRNYDVVLFVSGSKSSNGKVLLEICRANNPNTHWVSGPQDVNFDWFRNAGSVGICGATSTPQWLMESISQLVNESNLKSNF